MLVAFSMIPLDKGPHLSEFVARIVRIIDASELDYQLTPMATIVEGEWTPIFRLINKCRKELRKDSVRVSIQISVDDKAGDDNMLYSKVASVRKKLKTARRRYRKG